MDTTVKSKSVIDERAARRETLNKKSKFTLITQVMKLEKLVAAADEKFLESEQAFLSCVRSMAKENKLVREAIKQILSNLGSAVEVVPYSASTAKVGLIYGVFVANHGLLPTFAEKLDVNNSSDAMAYADLVRNDIKKRLLAGVNLGEDGE